MYVIVCVCVCVCVCVLFLCVLSALPSCCLWNRFHASSLTAQGRRKHSGQIVAMKFIVKHGKSEKDLKNLRQEINILQTLNHENIILLLDWFETKAEICVVTEYAQVRLCVALKHVHL